MTESNGFRAVVRFDRQMQPKQYETAAAHVELEQTYPASMSAEEVEKEVKRLFQLSKVAVYRELGLEFEQDEDTRVIMEVFPDAQVVTQRSKSAPAETLAPVTPLRAAESAAEDTPPATTPPRTPRASTGSRTSGGRSAPAREIDDDEAWEDLARNPGNWFDNTESKTNQKAPDFRATPKSGFKSTGGQYPKGLWLSNKPEDLVLPDDGYAG